MLLFFNCFYNQVQYLDCLDFGRQNVDQSIPRVNVWRGNMIRLYSELDRKRPHRFGKRNIKGVPAICCAQVALWFSFCFLFFLLSNVFLSYVFLSYVHFISVFLLILILFFMQGATAFRGKTQSPIFFPCIIWL
jgi:hypothetical protein